MEVIDLAAGPADSSTPPEIYTCEHCGYSCEHKSKLKRHHAREHVAEYGIPAGIRPGAQEETQGESKSVKEETENDDNKLAAGFAMEAMRKAKESKEEKGGRYCMQCRQLKWPSGRKVFRNVQDLAFHILTKHVWPTEKAKPDETSRIAQGLSGKSMQDRSSGQMGSFTNGSRVSISNEMLKMEKKKDAVAQESGRDLPNPQQLRSNRSKKRSGASSRNSVESPPFSRPTRSVPTQNTMCPQVTSTAPNMQPQRTTGWDPARGASQSYPIPYPVYYVPVHPNGLPMFPFPPQNSGAQARDQPTIPSLPINLPDESHTTDDVPLVARQDELMALRRKAMNILAPSPRPRVDVGQSAKPKKEITKYKKKKTKNKEAKDTLKGPQRIPKRHKTSHTKSHARDVQHTRPCVLSGNDEGPSRITRGTSHPREPITRHQLLSPHKEKRETLRSAPHSRNKAYDKEGKCSHSQEASRNFNGGSLAKNEPTMEGEREKRRPVKNPSRLHVSAVKMEPITFNFKRQRPSKPTQEEIENVAKRLKQEVFARTEGKIPTGKAFNESSSGEADFHQSQPCARQSNAIKEEPCDAQPVSVDGRKRRQAHLDNELSPSVRLGKKEDVPTATVKLPSLTREKVRGKDSDQRVVKSESIPLSSNQKPPVPARVKVGKSPRASIAEARNQRAAGRVVDSRKVLQKSLAALDRQAKPVALDLSVGLGSFKKRQRRKVKNETILLD